MVLSTRPEGTLGATCMADGRCGFLVWAPYAKAVEVHLHTPHDRYVAMQAGSAGYFQVCVEDVGPGSLYTYRLDGHLDRPDPASRCQPHDVHGPSMVVGASFPWQDQQWEGLPLQAYILYELHVGTFTAEGTFAALIPRLPVLKKLGITVIELMPIAQFPGQRNWGYDGVQPFAAQYTYGGPEGLKQLVNACHQQGLAVVLDVVYNHLGPEGNYLGDFGPYFTDRYKTPWGAALNFDGPWSDAVRRFFIENALYWLLDCHLDGLRLDAVHAIKDQAAYPFLEELAETVKAQAVRLNRPLYLIAESNLNDPRLLLPATSGGSGLDTQWNDDFHHALHALLTGERTGYYQDFGTLAHLATAWREGYVYTGQYSAYRQRRQGRAARVLPAHTLVVCAQNHDQIGNRPQGERLSQLVSFEQLKLAASVVLLSPYIPLLFMGEEYGETAPFHYFISHLDPALVAAVQRGRREEFAAFQWPSADLDPQARTTFERSQLDWGLREREPHRTLLAFTQTLIQLRTVLAPLASTGKETMVVHDDEAQRVLLVRRWSCQEEVMVLWYFGAVAASLTLSLPEGDWSKRLDSSETQWRGPGSTVPATLHVAGEMCLTLAPATVVLWVRQLLRHDKPQGHRNEARYADLAR